MTHVAEGTHFYDRQGKPVYELPNSSKGGMRPTTVRDARRMNLVPSVTTVIKMQAQPGLELWKADQAILAALTLPRREGEPEADWLCRVKHDSRAQGQAAADLGTQIHGAIQSYYERKAKPAPDMYDHVKGVVLCVGRETPTVPWFPERSFAHTSGYGGKCDLSSYGWVIDFKGKDFGPDEAPLLKTWDEHPQQLAAYRAGLKLHEARCAIVYFSRTHPGLARFIEIPESDLQRGWCMFSALLDFWKAKNRYDSAWTV